MTNEHRYDVNKVVDVANTEFDGPINHELYDCLLLIKKDLANPEVAEMLKSKIGKLSRALDNMKAKINAQRIP